MLKGWILDLLIYMFAYLFCCLFSIHFLQVMAETTKHSMHKIIMIWLIITIDLRVCID